MPDSIRQVEALIAQEPAAAEDSAAEGALLLVLVPLQPFFAPESSPLPHPAATGMPVASTATVSDLNMRTE